MPAGLRRRPAVVLLAVAVIVLGMAGTSVALVRWDASIANPEGIPVSHPRRERLMGRAFEFGALAPGGSYYSVVLDRFDGPPAQRLVVVDAVRGTVVSELSAGRTGGGIRETAWLDAGQLWVSVVEPAGGRCIEAYRASAPAWAFMPDDCRRRPATADQFPRHLTSPDGMLVAEHRRDRYGRPDFLDARPMIDDVRITGPDGAFLAQIGDAVLVGWTADGSLIVLDGRARASRIPRAEIDALLLKATKRDFRR